MPDRELQVKDTASENDFEQNKDHYENKSLDVSGVTLLDEQENLTSDEDIFFNRSDYY